MYSLHLTRVVSERVILSAKKEMDSHSTSVCHDKMYVKRDITEVRKKIHFHLRIGKNLRNIHKS